MMRAWPRLRSALVYTVSWTPLFLIYKQVISASNGPQITYPVLAAFKTVLSVALLGLAVRAIARRWPLPERVTVNLVLSHLALSLLFAGLWDASILLDLAHTRPTFTDVLRQARPWIFWQTFDGVLIYFAVLSLNWATGATERSRLQGARAAQSDALRVRAELDALRGQLDPHFLFNTLHSVSVLTPRDPVAATVAIERLAALLRYVLDSKRGARDDVLLADELAFVDDYLALEAIRFGTRLQVRREISEQARRQRVPSFALQPLVENAIKHGIAPRAAGGTLALNGSVEGGTLVLRVEDDGVGATVDAPPAGTGVGLDSLRRRLMARYGDAAGLTVESQPGHGFAVTMRLPVSP